MDGSAHQGLLEAPPARGGGVSCDRRAARGRVASLRFDLAVPGDDVELRRLLRENPMGGAISVSHEREPSFADALSIEGDRHQVVYLTIDIAGTLAGLVDGRTAGPLFTARGRRRLSARQVQRRLEGWARRCCCCGKAP